MTTSERGMTHAELVAIAGRWLGSQHGVVITEMGCGASEQPDAIGWRMGDATLIECKASRADFLRDAKKYFRGQMPQAGMAAYRYFLAPTGIIKPEELAEGWGLLEPHGKIVRNVKPAVRQPCDKRRECELLTSALRRMIGPGTQGVRCKTYQILGSGDARAAVMCEPLTEVQP